MPDRRTFLVTLDVPDGVTLDDAEVYIANALRAWRGPGPDETMAALDARTVDVVACRSTRRGAAREP